MNSINTEVLITVLHKLETDIATLSSIAICLMISHGLTMAILIAIWCNNAKLLIGGIGVLAVFGLPIAFFAFVLALLLVRRLWESMHSQKELL